MYYVRHKKNEYEKWEMSFIAPICGNKNDGQFFPPSLLYEANKVVIIFFKSWTGIFISSPMSFHPCVYFCYGN
jgi:hypothetical protein